MSRSVSTDDGRSRRLVRALLALAAPLVLAVILIGCGDGSGAAGDGGSARVHVTATVDPQNVIPDPKEGAEDTPYAPGETPAFLAGATERMKARYKFAATHLEEIAHIPCYCGCALYEHAHDSLRACFVRSVAADGKLVYTDHSLTCDICASEADMVSDLLGTGTPLAQIREQIHDKYKRTGVWTDTPPIQ